MERLWCDSRDTGPNSTVLIDVANVATEADKHKRSRLLAPLVPLFLIRRKASFSFRRGFLLNEQVEEEGKHAFSVDHPSPSHAEVDSESTALVAAANTRIGSKTRKSQIRKEGFQRGQKTLAMRRIQTFSSRAP